jgi:hypothetical protein
MLTVGGFPVDLERLTPWLVPAVGIAVAALVIGGVRLIARWRQRPLDSISREEDLPWDELLELLRQYRRSRPVPLPAAEDEGGDSLEDDVPPDNLLRRLLSDLPSRQRRVPEELPEDREFQATGGVEKRAGRRRWGNPTEVQLISATSDRRFGLVINRSTGGLAILMDNEVSPGILIGIRAAEAPQYVPTVQVEVRYCRKVGRNFLLGCKFCRDIPWNVRVWFG